MIVLVGPVLAFLFNYAKNRIMNNLLNEVALQQVGPSGVPQLAQQADGLRQQYSLLKASYRQDRQNWSSRLAALQSQIANAGHNFPLNRAARQASLASDANKYKLALSRARSQVEAAKAKYENDQAALASELAPSQSKLQQAMARGLAAAIQAKDSLRAFQKSGPAAFASAALPSLHAMPIAADKLFSILQADAEIQDANRPLIEQSLAGNFRFRHTGATSLAQSLLTHMQVLGTAAGTVFTMNASKPNVDALVSSFQEVSAADSALRQAIARSTRIVAAVAGTVTMTDSQGICHHLGALRVALLPEYLGTAVAPTLAAQRKYLTQCLTADESCVAAYNQTIHVVGSPLSLTLQRRDQRITLNLSLAQVKAAIVEANNRLARASQLFAKPPAQLGPHRMFSLSWNLGNPVLCAPTKGPPFVYPYLHPAPAFFLPWGVNRWVHRCRLRDFTATDASGAFRFENVPAGTYYIFACHASEPFAAWLVRVVVSSRQTAHVRLDATDVIEVNR